LTLQKHSLIYLYRTGNFKGLVSMKKIDLRTSPGFLVGRIAHRLTVHIRKFIDEADIQISAEELAVLTALAQFDSKKSMGELADQLGRDPTTLKRQLNGLVKTGLVNRSNSPEDGRVILISITEAGRTLVESTMPMTIALRERALEGVSESDRKALGRILSQMLQNLMDR
jgi:DNA-binding MarR family transcriptional regulator